MKFTPEMTDRWAKISMIKKEITQAKEVLSSWLSTMTKLKGTGSLLEQQTTDIELNYIGSSLVNVIASNRNLAIVQEALIVVEDKHAMFNDLDRRFAELGRLGQKRNRVHRKHNEKIAQRERKTSITGGNPTKIDTQTRYTSALQDAYWSYEELESELIAECEFWLSEACRNGGICADELEVIKCFSQTLMPICCDKGLDVATSMPHLDVVETFEAWRSRKITYVLEGKQRRMQSKLENSGNGVIELHREEQLVIKTTMGKDPEKSELPQSAGSPATSPNTEHKEELEFCTPRTARSPLGYGGQEKYSRLHQNENVVTEHQQIQSPTPNLKPKPSLEDNDQVSIGNSSLGSSAPYIDRWSRQFSANVQSTPQFEQVREMVADAFLVGIGKGWEAYVSRSSGENFWFNPRTMEVCHIDPMKPA